MKTPDKILFRIKSHGPQSVTGLSTEFELTTMGVRQHLNSLTKNGLIEHFERNEGVGRPTRYWQLTEQGHARYPDCHSDLTVALIETVQSIFGQEGLDKVIAQRESDSMALYTRELSPHTTIISKLEALANLRSKEGYMATWQQQDNDYLLIENHCPICAAATSCQNFCQSELNQFQQLFASLASVKRTEHIIDGARRCCYLITPLL